MRMVPRVCLKGVWYARPFMQKLGAVLDILFMIPLHLQFSYKTDEPRHESCCRTSHLSRIVRKRDYCLCENKGADQLRSNCEADQRLCFRYSDSTIPLLLKSEISSFYLFSELVQAGLCRTWSKTPKTGFLASRLIYAVTA